jgi:DNA mismatch repair protein MutS
MELEALTPMQRQYQELKNEVPDAILFFRLGDFYEMFGSDAEESSKILDITLTTRDRKSENPIPMCGIPHHAAEQYLAKLIRAGKKVAIAEQVSDPSLPGLVQRKIVRIISPGTTFSENSLEAKESNYIVSVAKCNGIIALAFADITTGDFFVLETNHQEEALLEIRRFSPKEMVMNPKDPLKEAFSHTVKTTSFHAQAKNTEEFLLKFFNLRTLKGFGIQEKQASINAAALLCSFFWEVEKGALPHFLGIRVYDTATTMPLDYTTIKTLELFEGSDGRRESSLLGLLDETKTAMGGRLLRKNMSMPFRKEERISERLEAVEELQQNPELFAQIESCLMRISDLERLMGRFATGRASPKDFLSLRDSLEYIQSLINVLQHTKSPLLQSLYMSLESWFYKKNH